MLRRLQSRLLSAVRTASPLPPLAASSLHHLLHLYSTAAATTTTGSAAPFVAEDYLVTVCGLTPAQALKASTHLAHLKSPSKPDAVLAFFADAGLAKGDVAAAITKDPRILCSKVGATLTPSVARLREIGLSPAQISRLISIQPGVMSCPVIVSRLPFYLSFLGSYDRVHTALRRTLYLLQKDVDRVVQPNMDFLRQQCGLTDGDVAELMLFVPRIFLFEPERLKDTVAWVRKLDVQQDSGMFKHALLAICYVRRGEVAAKIESLKKAVGWSEPELRFALRAMPRILSASDERLGRTARFLKVEVGLDAGYIARRPALLTYSVRQRLMPRHEVIKALKEKGLVKKDLDFLGVVNKTDKTFIKRFIDPFKESVPGLADSYAAALAQPSDPTMTA